MRIVGGIKRMLFGEENTIPKAKATSALVIATAAFIPDGSDNDKTGKDLPVAVPSKSDALAYPQLEVQADSVKHLHDKRMDTLQVLSNKTSLTPFEKLTAIHVFIGPKSNGRYDDLENRQLLKNILQKSTVSSTEQEQFLPTPGQPNSYMKDILNYCLGLNRRRLHGNNSGGMLMSVRNNIATTRSWDDPGLLNGSFCNKGKANKEFANLIAQKIGFQETLSELLSSGIENYDSQKQLIKQITQNYISSPES